MNNIIILPIIIPLISAMILLLCKKNKNFQRVASVTSAILLIMANVYILVRVATEGPIALSLGGYAAPFGVIYIVDTLSGIMLVLGSIVSFVGLLYSFQTICEERENHGYYCLWQFLILGVGNSFITGDVFNLFISFEILLFASYTLLVIGSTKPQLKATFSYMIVNILSSVIFLIGVGTLYSITGTLNMADIAIKMQELGESAAINFVSMIFLVVFGIKSAIFPLFFWLPSVYDSAQSAVTVFFSGILTKVGVYSILRFFTLIFVGNIKYTHSILTFLAVASMLLGVLGAVSHNNYKRILGFHSVSQIGYMILGVSMYSVSGVAAAIYFIVHHGIVKSGLFLTAGISENMTGEKNIKNIDVLFTTYPSLAWGYFLLAMSLAGVPPFSGFLAKFLIVKSALEFQSYITVFFAMAVGILTLYSMTKIFINAYWQSKERERKGHVYIITEHIDFKYSHVLVPMFMLLGLSLALGLMGEGVLELCVKAAEELIDGNLYIETVFSVDGNS